jgi:hypothetical protein
LQEAQAEIKRLKERLDYTENRLEVYENMMMVFKAYPGGYGMKSDGNHVGWQLQMAIDELGAKVKAARPERHDENVVRVNRDSDSAAGNGEKNSNL